LLDSPISEANNGKKHPMYGKHHSKKSKKKMSETMKSRKKSKEGRGR